MYNHYVKEVMAIKFSQFREIVQEEALDLSSDIQKEIKKGSRLGLLSKETKINSLSRTYLKREKGNHEKV